MSKSERKPLLINAEPVENRGGHDSTTNLGREIEEVFPDGLTTHEANQR